MPSGQRLEGKVAIVTGAGTRGEIAGQDKLQRY